MNADKILVEKVHDEQSQGILDHKWLVRHFLSSSPFIQKQIIAPSNPLPTHARLRQQHPLISKDFIFLLDVALSPFVYVEKNRDALDQDPNLKAICELCTHRQHLTDVYRHDDRLHYLSRTFNQLIGSRRNLFMCYDCGTVARGIFFMLIKANRGKFIIKNSEISRIRSDYNMDKYDVPTSLAIFRKHTQEIQQNCLFMCAVQLGENKFGHIYIIEKSYIDVQGQRKPRYRLYQSCHLSYMLIDYIELMDYASDPLKGIDINQHIDDLSTMLTTGDWNQETIQLFVEWYHFYPSSRIFASDVKKFASTYIIF